MAKKAYNGHESYSAWNVSLWISNDEPIYREAIRLKAKYSTKAAARLLLRYLGGSGSKTEDGIRYSLRSIELAISDL